MKNIDSNFLHTVIKTAPVVFIASGALLFAATVLYRFRKGWRWIRFTVHFTRPDNVLQLLAGEGLDLLLDQEHSPLRRAILRISIPMQVLKCVHDYQMLGHAYKKWVQAIRGDCLYDAKIDWAASAKPGLLSPSQQVYLKQHLLLLRMRAKRVMKCSYRLFKRMLILSSSCLDTIEALSLEKSACDETIRRLFLDLAVTLHRTAEKKEEILEVLQEKTQLTNKFLKWLGATYRADSLYTMAEEGMEHLEAIDQVVQKVTRSCNGAIAEAGKFFIFEVYSFLGIAEKIPAEFFPSENEKPLKSPQGARYVPDEWLAQPSRAPKKKRKKKAREKIELFVEKQKKMLGEKAKMQKKELTEKVEKLKGGAINKSCSAIQNKLKQIKSRSSNLLLSKKKNSLLTAQEVA